MLYVQSYYVPLEEGNINIKLLIKFWLQSKSCTVEVQSSVKKIMYRLYYIILIACKF